MHGARKNGSGRAQLKALVLAPFSDQALTDLGRLAPTTYESWTVTRKLYSPEELAHRLKQDDIGILVIEADFVFDETLEQRTPLKLLGVCRQDLGHVDLEAATRQGVLVVNTPGRNAGAVAELTLALMLSLARRVPQLDCYVKQERWMDPVEGYLCFRGVELQGKTLGILGLGSIGRMVSRMGRALGMKVLAYDPYVGVPGERHSGALLCDLDQVLTEADFLSLHLPSSSETEGLLDGNRLAKMKKGSYLINTAAHSLVDETALVKHLQAGHLAGAAFDVHEAHPIPPTSPLLHLENVILTPHVGGATQETVERYSAMMVEDIQRFLQGRRPRHLANPEAWRPCG